MSYSDEQLRGAILEEGVLYLLKWSGYAPLGSPGLDPTFRNGRSGLEVRGRGTWHQSDAIADFRVTPPFGHPIRLLVEAKFLSTKIGLSIIRNSAGVLKDVTENWVFEAGTGGLPARQRYHYLSAVFSATEFTGPAQEYAYAQDVYLVPLARSSFIDPVINAISEVSAANISEQVTIAQVRNFLRQQFLGVTFEPARIGPLPGVEVILHEVIVSCNELRYGAIAMFGGRFPAFLIAAPDTDIMLLPDRITVRIRWIDDSWFIEDQNGRPIFSFDLPEELFRLYADAGVLNRQGVAEMKGDAMSNFYAYQLRHDNELRVMQFHLDQDWFAEVREKVGPRHRR